MDAIQKTLWFVETRLGEPFTLEDVAEAVGLSRHYLVRAFGAATGRSVMRYVRGRRLTEAARGLAGGAPDILAVALDAGYGSHEAFTRAFREQFGVTPERVRERGCATALALVEPLRLEAGTPASLPAPRWVEAGPILLAGILQHYRDDSLAGIPTQWRRFSPWFGHIPAQRRNVSYGVVCNADDFGTIDYLAAAQVTDFADVPDELTRLRLSAQRYAVFAHDGHVAEITGFWRGIWGGWVPSSGVKLADAPFFEFYPERFDPETGTGGFELWLPVAG
jgi:AraC family transcriptional regulator